VAEIHNGRDREGGWRHTGDVQIRAPGNVTLKDVLEAHLRPRDRKTPITCVTLTLAGGAQVPWPSLETVIDTLVDGQRSFFVKAQRLRSPPKAKAVHIADKDLPLDLSHLDDHVAVAVQERSDVSSESGQGREKRAKVEPDASSRGKNEVGSSEMETGNGSGDLPVEERISPERMVEIETLLIGAREAAAASGKSTDQQLQACSKILKQQLIGAKELPTRQGVSWSMSKLLRAAKATCMIEWRHGRFEGIGTGVYIGLPGIYTCIVTSYHMFLTPDERDGSTTPNDQVVKKRMESARFRSEFAGWALRKSHGVCASSPFTAVPKKDSLDYVCFEVRDRVFLKEHAPLSFDTLKVTQNQPISLLHHPSFHQSFDGGAEELQLSPGHVTHAVKPSDVSILHSIVCTRPGSSGAPFFDSDWMLVGLHAGQQRCVKMALVRKDIDAQARRLHVPACGEREVAYHLFTDEGFLGTVSFDSNNATKLNALRGTCNVCDLKISGYQFVDPNGKLVPRLSEKIVPILSVLHKYHPQNNSLLLRTP